MKKIKNYKINLRRKEILRVLKKTTQVTDITPEIEERVQTESLRLQDYVMPSAIYDTKPKDKIPDEFIKDKENANYIAATMYFVTIGDKIEQEIKAIHERGDNILEQIIHSIALEATEQSINFIQRLVKDEAENQDCEITRGIHINSPDSISKLLSILPGDKININFEENRNLYPLYSSAGTIYWMPLKKQRKK
ncbi:hypothetical protein ACFL58_04510 [Elusimicrobiota bacterium]